MRSIIFILSFSLITFVFLSCESKRPDAGSFEYSLSVSSIQAKAEVEIMDGAKSVATATTDEEGKAEFKSLKVVSDLKIKVCGGSVTLVSIADPVDWSGCNEIMFTPVEKETNSVVVDFLSTLIKNYDSETATEEWMSYLDVTTLPHPALQTSLTDATKRYLWLQGFAVIAKNISEANGVTPESQYSTESLVNLIKDDLADDKIINGSTSKLFGTLNIDAAVLKNIIAEAIPQVSTEFSSSDLKDWTDKIENSDAAFLGGSGSETDKEKPVIEVVSPDGENPVVYGTVTIHVKATDNVSVASLDCGITAPVDAPDIEDTKEEPEIFVGSFDSSPLADGSITFKCIASDGTNIAEKEFSVTLSNNNTVELKAYITNELTDWDSVVVFDYDGNKVGTYSFLEDEEPEIGLAPGDYTFVFKGGYYKPVFLTDESLDFDSELTTNQAVLPGETTTVIATPLTTIRQKLYDEFKGTKSPQDAVEKSFELISEHIDSDFPLYIEPVSKNQLTENSKYYIVLAGLERLAVLIGERHDPALESGAITIEQVMKALIDDIETVDEGVLDGNGLINQFAVDSYLFRYWYAIAVKLFLESDENKTGLGFSDLQTVINNIAMDDSELFPSGKAPKRVTDQPPVISEKQFKRSFETEFADYSLENIIYSNTEVFSVKFKALPDESGDLWLDTVEIFGDVEVQNLTDINEEGIYTADLTFTDGEDGDKSVGLRVVDNAENTGTATLQAVKDTVIPVITDLGSSLGENVTTPLTVPYSVTETNPLDTLYSVTPSGDTPAAWTSLDPAFLSGDITVTDAMLTDDGAYTLHFRTVDKAGNEVTQTKSLVFDREIPTATFTTVPEINENGFIQTDTIEITIIAADNVTPENELIHEYFDGVSWVENISETKNVWVLQSLSDQLYERKYRVKDLAGNKSDDINVNFNVDTSDPVLTTNKTSLESRAYNINDEDLKLISTCSDSNADSYTYSINGGDVIDIVDQSTPLTGNEALASEGTHTITVLCSDLSGREVEETINIVIDNTPPSGSVISGPSQGEMVCDISQAIGIQAVDDVSSPVTAHYFYYVNDMAESSVFNVDLNSSDQASLIFPGSGDSFYSNSDNYINKVNNVSFLFSMKDEAGNESMPFYHSWNIDRQPPKASFYEVDENYVAVVIDGSDPFSLDELIAAPDMLVFLDEKADEAGLNDIASIKSYINGSLNDTFTVVKDVNTATYGECYNFMCGGENETFLPCRLCLHSGSVPDEFTSKAVFTDSCGNSGSLSDCKDNDYFCLTRYVNVANPPLFIAADYIEEDSLQITLQAEGANIESCGIYKGSTFIQSCQTVQGSQVINTSAFSEGTYTVEASSKFSGGSEITEKEKDFIVDRTPFSLSIDLKNGESYYLKEAPVLQYSINIASGVKSVTFELHDRTVNYRYAPGSYSCNGSTGLCTTNSYDKYIYSSDNSSGTFSIPISGMFGVDGGIYTTISYEVEPVFGDIERGEKTITEINLITSDSEDLELYESSGQIRFRESIISKKLSDTFIRNAGFDHYPKICKKNDYYFYYKRNVLTSPGISRNINASDLYGTITPTQGESVYYFGREGSEGAYSADDTCSSSNDCPSTAGLCENRVNLTDGKECVAYRGGDHYSDSGSFPWPGNRSCDCDDWSGNESCLEANCYYLRDMEYYPEGAFIIVYDNSPRPSVTKYLKDLGISVKKQSDCF